MHTDIIPHAKTHCTMDYNHINYLLPFKLFWRCAKSACLRIRHIYISPLAMFNGRTTLSPYSVVHRGACVGDTGIGKYTFVERNAFLPNSTIGCFCSIARNVRIIQYTHPSRGFISTSPALYSTAGQCGKYLSPRQLFQEQRLVEGRSVIIGNDVWIGENAKLIEGIRIGHGAIIGAGAVVTKDVPDYAVVAGVPAKVIRYRYTPEEIRLLLRFRWWDKDEKWLRQHAELMADDKLFLKKLE